MNAHLINYGQALTCAFTFIGCTSGYVANNMVRELRPSSKNSTLRRDTAQIVKSFSESSPLKKSIFLQPKEMMVRRNSQNMTETTTEPTYTTQQLRCAEELGVDPSECNRYGVFTNRTPQLKDEILAHLYAGAWHDVTTLMIYHIININVMNKGIQNLKKEDLHGCYSLRRLNLSGNQITEIPPGFFDATPRLNEVYIENTPLTILPDNLLSHLSELNELHLSHNQLTTMENQTFAPHTTLESLQIDHNQISYIPENFLDHLKHLKTLSLNNNHLKSLPDNLLSSQKNLQILRTYDNPLVVSKAFFLNLLNFPPPFAFEYHNHQQNIETTYLELNKTFIPILEISIFFNTTTEDGIESLHPNITLPPAKNSNFTDNQRWFLCFTPELQLDKNLNLSCVFNDPTTPTPLFTSEIKFEKETRRTKRVNVVPEYAIGIGVGVSFLIMASSVVTMIVALKQSFQSSPKKSSQSNKRYHVSRRETEKGLLELTEI